MLKTRLAYLLAFSIMTGTISQSQALDLSRGLSGGNVGEVGGAVVGGVGGNYLAKKSKLGKTGQLAATIGGTIVGGMLGGTLGKQLDATSRARAEHAQIAAVSSGTRQTWQAPYKSGAGNGTWGAGAANARAAQPAGHATGSIEPGNPYQTANGICRDFTHTIKIEGRMETARGIACRNPDGTWRYAS